MFRSLRAANDRSDGDVHTNRALSTRVDALSASVANLDVETEESTDVAASMDETASGDAGAVDTAAAVARLASFARPLVDFRAALPPEALPEFDALAVSKQLPLPLPLRATGTRRRAIQWRVVLALLFVSAVFTTIWHEGLKYRFIAKRWGVVVPGAVYRSGQLSRWVFDRQIADHGVTTIIDLNGVEKHDRNQHFEVARVRDLGIAHYRFPLGGDGQGDIRRYADALEVIDDCLRRGESVLVHCSAGAQRTGGAFAFYRVLLEGRSPAEACLEMRDYGWRPERDVELVPYLNAHVGELARLLVERGVLDRVPEPLPRFPER